MNRISKRNLVFQVSIFKFYVSLQGVKNPLHSTREKPRDLASGYNLHNECFEFMEISWNLGDMFLQKDV